jgi:ubiquinone/menaquinone biosynthesis C-methylase UbiE
MIRHCLTLVCALLLPACAQKAANTPEPSAAPGINDRYKTEEGRATTIKILEGEGREKYQKPDQIIRNMDLKSGDIVCEIGAGTGYFTPFLSRAVASAGKVYAEDPQPEFLAVLKEKKAKERLDNVEIVLGTYTDTNLPDGRCDVTFVLDAYHHFEWPKPMLDAMKRDTKSNGRLVVVDFYRKQNEFFEQWGIDALKHLRLDLEGVIEEITSHGWKHVETRTFLPLQYFVVFTPR